MSPFVQVLSTVNDQAQAQEMARKLVERKLAACVQVVGPITSTYRWKEMIEVDQEWMLVCKTRGALFAVIEAAIRELHPYETPEIVAVPILEGSRGYLAWMDAELVRAPEV
jgi:periplasmic divalent cation tolerance protein